LELKRFGGKYTSTNKQVNPMVVNLDRILISPEWAQQFPLCSSSSLVRVGSDHSPIILNSGEGSVVGESQLHFEKQWFLDPDFKDKVLSNIAESFCLMSILLL
jgi:hypothetical protein